MEVNKSIISIITLTWNSGKYIGRCIESLVEDARNSNIEIEIYVVDNGSSDNTISIIEYMQKGISFPLELIKLGTNHGTTISRNIGIKKASGEYLLIIDSDTVVKKGTLNKLVTYIQKEEKVGIVAPRLFYPDGTVQESCKKFPTLSIKLCKVLPSKVLRTKAEFEELYSREVYTKEFNKIVHVDYCISAAWLINKKALNDIGLFDENIFYSPEDVDLCLRMWLGGWKVVYYPEATVIHHTQRLSYKNKKIAISHIKGLLYFFNKHRYWFDRKKLYRKINSYPIYTKSNKNELKP